jgi:uncharacterized phage protein gp47/JayE
MPYFQPFIDGEGLHIPTYQDIEDHLVAQARSIFGQNIYLENDSQDFQDIAARAKVIYDTMLTAQLAYNARSPKTGIGVGLDGVVACNGIKRKAGSKSIATVTLTGTAFTVINNGVVRDINGNLWDLPASVTIGAGGTVSVTATCREPGAIVALENQINSIETPTAGWTSVTNPANATPGQPVEEDSGLRNRQMLSVANPSQALTGGILGGVLAVENVLDAVLYENDTNVAVDTINGAFNPNDFPPHSVTLVVDGGDGEAVARAIYLRKTPGAGTDGTEEYTFLDQYNVPTVIKFFRPEEKTIKATLTIDPLSGYTSEVGDDIKQAVVDYINSLKIGQSLVNSELWQAALNVDNGQFPLFALRSVVTGVEDDPQTSDDITLNFDQKAVTELEHITLTVL